MSGPVILPMLSVIVINAKAVVNRSMMSPPRLGTSWNPVAISAWVSAKYIVLFLICCGMLVLSANNHQRLSLDMKRVEYRGDC